MIKLLLVFIGIPAGIALAIFGGMAAVNASSLQSQGKVVDATVTKSQTSDQNASEIQYQFRVGTAGAAYSHSDETGRRNLWETVSVMPAGKTVQVRYLPSNPWVNRAVSDTSNPVESAFVALGVGVLLVVVGLFLLIADIRAWRKKRAPQPGASV